MTNMDLVFYAKVVYGIALIAVELGDKYMSDGL